MMKKRYLSQFCIRNVFILCSKILLNVPYNLGLLILFPMATYWVPDLPNIKGIPGHPRHSIFMFANGALIYMIQQAYKYVRIMLRIKETIIAQCQTCLLTQTFRVYNPSSV